MRCLKSSIFRNDEALPPSEEAAVLLSDVYAELLTPYLRRKWTLFVVGCVIAGAGVLVLFMSVKVGLVMLAASGVPFAFAFTSRARGGVRSMSRVHWTAVQAPLGDQSLLLDCSGAIPEETLNYPYLDDAAAVEEVHRRFVEAAANLPPVLSPDKPRTVVVPPESVSLTYGSNYALYDVERELLGLIDIACAEVERQSQSEANLGVFRADGDVVGFLSEQARAGNMTAADPGKSLAVQNPLARAAVTDEIAGVRSRAGAGDGKELDLDDFFVEMDQTWEALLAGVGEVRGDALAKALQTLAYGLQRAFWENEFYWYCPSCNSHMRQADPEAGRFVGAELDPRMRVNPETRLYKDPRDETWYCPLCDVTRRLSARDFALNLPRFNTDLFGKVYERLALEHVVERQQILNGINDQKRQYLNDEFGRISETEERHLRELSEIEDSLHEVVAALQGDEMALSSFSELAAKYERLDRERVNTYVADARRIQHEIEADAVAAAENMRAYSGQLLEEARVEAQRRAMLRNEVEECRHQEQMESVRQAGEMVASEVHLVGHKIDTLTEETHLTNRLLLTMVPKRYRR